MEKRKKEVKGMMKILGTVEPEMIKAMTENGWEETEMAVDSAATETVVGEEMLESVETKEGAAKKRGTQYEVADGTLIPNLGEKTFAVHSEDGQVRCVTAQVCDVNKSLLSVRKVTKAGNRVVFEDGYGYIEDKVSGEKMYMVEKDGLYVLKLWVPAGGFSGQGQ